MAVLLDARTSVIPCDYLSSSGGKTMIAQQVSVRASGRHMVRLLQKRGCHQRHDEGEAQEIERVAEGQNVGLLLQDVADGHIGAAGRVSGIGDPVTDEVVRELGDAGAGSFLE